MIVGEATVVLRAMGDKLQADISAAVNKAGANAGRSGSDAGKSFSDNFGSQVKNNLDGKLDGAFNSVEGTARDTGRRAGDRMGDGIQDGVRRGIDRARPEAARGGSGLGGSVGNAFRAGFERSNPGRGIAAVALKLGVLIPILGALGGGLATVVSGLFAMTSAAAAAANALVVLPSILGAVIQAGGTLLAAFSGVGQALSAGLKPATGGGAAKAAKSSRDLAKQVDDSAKRIRDASEALGDAERNSARAIIAANRGVRDAKEAVSDAYFNAGERQEDAIRRVAAAEKDSRDASDNLRDATQRLTDARKEALETLIDLQFESRKGALSEQRAQFQLADALAQLQRVQELPPNSRLRQEAELSFKEAQLNLEMIQEKNGDVAEEQQKAKQQGIEGSDAVVDAKKDLADAEDAVKEAVYQLSEAYEDQTRAQIENTRSIRDSREALQLAKQALGDAFHDGPRSIRNATEALQEARRAARDLGADIASGAAGAGGGVDAFAQAMSKLSPEAQAFVRYLISIQSEFKKLRNAAGRDLFPRLETALRNLVSGLFPSLATALQTTGRAIGQAAIQISRDLTSGPFLANFGTVTEQNATTVRRLGFVFGDLTRVAFALLAAAEPLIDRFTNFIRVWAENTRRTTELNTANGKLTETFVHAGDVAAQLGRIISNIVEGLFDFGKVGSDSGQSLLDSFEKATEKFANFTDKAKNVETLKKYFDDVATNMRAVSSLAAALGLAFLRLGDDPGVAKTAAAFEKIIPQLEKALSQTTERLGPLLAELFGNIVATFNELSESGAIETAINILNGFFVTLNKLLNIPGVGTFVGALLSLGAAMKTISLIRGFPGISLLDKGISGLFSKNADGVRGFTRIKTALSEGLPQAAKLAKSYSGLAKNTAAAAFEQGKLKAAAVGGALKNAASSIGQLARNYAGVARGALVAAANQAKALAVAAGGRIAAAATTAWAFAQRLLNGAMRANPILLIVTAIGLLVGGLILAYKKSETFRNIVNGAFNAVKNVASKVFGAIVKVVKTAFNFIRDNWQLILGILLGPFGLVVGLIAKNFDKIKGLAKAAVGKITGFFGGIGDKIGGAFDGAKSIAGKAADGIKGAFSNVGGAIGSAFGGIKDKVGPAFAAMRDKIVAIATTIGEKLKVVFGPLVPFLTAPFKIAKMLITGDFEGVGEIGKKVVDKIIGAFRGLISRIGGILGGLGTTVNGYFTNIKNYISNAIGAAVGAVATFLTNMVNGFKIIGSRVATAAGDLFKAIRDRMGAAKNWVAARITDIIVGIRNIGARVAANIGDAFGTIRTKISAAKTYVSGRITDIILGIRGIGARVAANIGDAFGAVKSKIEAAREYVGGKITSIVQAVKDIGSRLANMKNPFSALGGFMKSALNQVVDAWNSVDFGVNISVPDWVPKYGGKSFKVNDVFPDIPRLATGGVAMPTRGGINAVLAEAGKPERITPLNSKLQSNAEVEMINMLRAAIESGAIGGREPANFNVYPAPGMSEREVGKAAVDQYAWISGTRS